MVAPFFVAAFPPFGFLPPPLLPGPLSGMARPLRPVAFRMTLDYRHPEDAVYRQAGASATRCPNGQVLEQGLQEPSVLVMGVIGTLVRAPGATLYGWSSIRRRSP